MWGKFSERMAAAMRPHVVGQRVIDLGCGDGVRAKKLVSLGASEVIAVDHHDSGNWNHPDIEYWMASFAEALAIFRKESYVAHVAWPWVCTDSQEYALIDLLDAAHTIIYVGKNTGGTICGTPLMFGYLRGRSVMAYEPDRINTMIVYGQRCPRRSHVYYEEHAGLWSEHDKIAAFRSTLDTFDASIPTGDLVHATIGA